MKVLADVDFFIETSYSTTRMMLKQHLLDCEVNWSKKNPKRIKSAAVCKAQTRKLIKVPEAIIDIDAIYSTKLNWLAINNDEETTSASFNYVLNDDGLHTLSSIAKNPIDLKPAKTIATNNVDRINQVLKRAKTIDPKKSIIFGLPNFVTSSTLDSNSFIPPMEFVDIRPTSAGGISSPKSEARYF